MDKRAVFSCLFESDVCSHWGTKDVTSCAIFRRNRDEGNYTL